MDKANEVTNELRARGCSVLRMGYSKQYGHLLIVGHKGRDIIAFCPDGCRTKFQQQFAEAWCGIPPVDLRCRTDAKALADLIAAGEFDDNAVMATMRNIVISADGLRRLG